jgi:integrase/recombinase XerD
MTITNVIKGNTTNLADLSGVGDALQSVGSDKFDKNEKRVLDRFSNFVENAEGTKILSYKEELKATHKRLVNNLLNDVRLSEGQKKIMNDYYSFLVNHTPSLATRKTYLQYAKLLAIRVERDFQDITKGDLKRFFVDLETKYDLNYNSIFNAKIYIRFFYFWYCQEYEGWKPNSQEDYPDIVEWIVLKKKFNTKTLDEIFSPEEVKKLVQVAPNYRDKAIHFVLYECGSRKGEFLQLCIKHIKFDENGAVLVIPEGKTNSRNVRLVESVPALRRWFEMHPLKDDPEAPLWLNLGSHLGKSLGGDGLKVIVKRDARLAGISLKKAYPHSYRHCRATQLVREGLAEAHLRIIFGWSNSSRTPSTYIHLANCDVDKKLLEIAGIVEAEDEESILKPQKCVKCGYVNSAELSYCEKCEIALNVKTVLEDEEKRRSSEEEIISFIENVKKKLSPDEFSKILKG